MKERERFLKNLPEDPFLIHHYTVRRELSPGIFNNLKIYLPLLIITIF